VAPIGLSLSGGASAPEAVTGRAFQVTLAAPVAQSTTVQ
jgi:hypothetical protein